MNRVMFLEDGDDTRVINVSTQAMLELTALAVVKSRFTKNYYPAPDEPRKPSMSLNEIKKLKDDNIKEYGLMVWKTYRENLAVFRQEQERWQCIKTCIDSNDGLAAISILHYRNDFQGERIKIADVHDFY